MTKNEELIHRFYSSFQKKDYKTMQACYSEKVIFSDDVFRSLSYKEVCAMWHMLLTSSSDLALTFEDVTADELNGSCRWTAVYTFTLTKRNVTNRIQAQFKFENAKISVHTDAFNFHRWARQAFGMTGLILGWTPFFRRKVQATARQRLHAFIEKHPEYAR